MRNSQIKMTFRVGQSTESPPPRPQTERIYFGEDAQFEHRRARCFQIVQLMKLGKEGNEE